MGTASTTKVLKNNAGTLTEETTLTTSAGAADANKIPALNASGVLDSSIVNSKNTSAGAADAGKLAALNASGILDDSIINATVASAANKVVKLGADGKLDVTVMPTGIGADTAVIVASEALAAGDLVNIWNDGGTAKVRKADASVAGKEAHGFVLAAVSNAANATVYFEGSNNSMHWPDAGCPVLVCDDRRQDRCCRPDRRRQGGSALWLRRQRHDHELRRLRPHRSGLTNKSEVT